jgi:hypothetical protein
MGMAGAQRSDLDHRLRGGVDVRAGADLRVLLGRLIADEGTSDDLRRRAQWLLWGIEGRDVVAEALARWGAAAHC